MEIVLGVVLGLILTPMYEAQILHGWRLIFEGIFFIYLLYQKGMQREQLRALQIGHLSKRSILLSANSLICLLVSMRASQ